MKGPLLRISSHRVKDNSHSRCVFFETLSLIVDNCFSTQTEDVVQVGRAGGRDYMKASLLRQLYGVRANVARGSMDVSFTRFRGPFDYAASVIRAALSNSPGLT